LPPSTLPLHAWSATTEVMSLSAEDSTAFAASLLRPAAPGRHLRKAAVRYKKGA